MLASRILPQSHLTDQTKSVVTVSTGVVGTLTALVLGLLIAAASSSYSTKNQEVILIAADVIRTDRLLRRYGPETEGLRDLLRRYTTMKIQDLFPEGTTELPDLANPRTDALLEELQDRLVAFDAANPNQRWLQSQALQLLSAIAGARWLLVEQNTIGIAFPLLVLVVFWLALLFLSFGLFAPRKRDSNPGAFPLRARGRGRNRNDAGAECAFPGNHPDLQQADERRPRPNQPQIRPPLLCPIMFSPSASSSGKLERRRFIPTFALVMGVAALLATVLHGIEAATWAVAYQLLGALPELIPCGARRPGLPSQSLTSVASARKSIH